MEGEGAESMYAGKRRSCGHSAMELSARRQIGMVRTHERPLRRSLKRPTTQPTFVFHAKAVAVVQVVSSALQFILHPQCRSPEDAGATRSRRVFSSPSWSSVSLGRPTSSANAHGRSPLRRVSVKFPPPCTDADDAVAGQVLLALAAPPL